MKDNEWISCDDRMPDKDDDYLCKGDDIEMEIVWFEIDFGWREGYGVITHWQELPN